MVLSFRYYITRAKLVSKVAKYPHVVSGISSISTSVAETNNECQEHVRRSMNELMNMNIEY